MVRGVSAVASIQSINEGGGEQIGMGAAAVQGQIPELWAGWVGVGLHAVNGFVTDADAVPPYS